MKVGIALPTMAEGFSGPVLREWCRLVDDGSFSSISTGERISFFNPEMITTLAASAALTSRVDVMANLVVAPLHRPAMLAKQLATIDVLSEGRLVVGLGVGGRPHDYASQGVPFERRHAQVDEMATELRRLWSQEPPFEGADPVGPIPHQPGGPPLMAGAMGPASMARAARWADGVTGFSITGTPQDYVDAAEQARQAWHDAGRTESPWLGSGTFCVLGVQDSLDTLRRFAATYLGFLGPKIAEAVASGLDMAEPSRLVATLDGARAAGLDELTLVAGTWDLGCIDALADVVDNWRR